MYGELPNGGMTKIESRNIIFMQNYFSNIGEIKKDLETQVISTSWRLD